MRERRRLFWAAVWLAVTFIGVKAYYLGAPAVRVAEPRATGKCRVRYNRLFPGGEEPPKFFDWLDSTKWRASHLHDKAGSREIVGVFPGRRVSSNNQVLASSCFLFLFR